MSILNLAKNRKRIKKVLGAITALFMVFMLLATCLPSASRAGNIGDVVNEIAKRNSLTYWHLAHDTEPVSGGSFNFYEGIGELSTGWVCLAIDEPVSGTPMQAVIDFNVRNRDDEAVVSVIPITGYQTHEYTMPDGAGVWIILPKYMIEVEIYETGNNSAADLQTARSLAQQLLNGLESNGFLNQPATGKKEATNQGNNNSVPSSQEVVSGTALDEPVKISDTMNIAGVGNGPTVPTIFKINSPHLVTFITTYHWNNARGATPGTIFLKSSDAKTYGPWQATSRPGQGGVPNAYWEVSPNIVIPAGTYTVMDSDPATWSQNSQSGGRGMGEVRATPHFKVTNGSANDLTNTSGSRTKSSPGGYIESPAGVGSVGNIPGPANTTEAVVGVAVPGLIATALGALGGLSGGGGVVPPASGTPLYPAGGGPLPGAGGTAAGTGAGSVGMAQGTHQIGRRRNEENYISGPENDHVFTPESGYRRDNINEANIDTVVSDKEVIRVQLEPEIIIDTDEEGAIISGLESGLIIETALEEAGVMKPDSGNLIDSSDNGILIDTRALEDNAPAQADVIVAGKASAAQDATGSKTEATEISEESAYDREGYNSEGFNKEGFNRDGFDKEGFDKEGFDESGFDKQGFNKAGFDKEGFNREGFDQSGFDKEGFNKEGFDKTGFNKEGFNKSGFDAKGFDKEGFNQAGFNKEGFNREGFDQSGFDKEGFNKEGFDKTGFNKEGFNKVGFDKEGFDKEGYNKEGFDREGYGRNGFNSSGYDREGFDVNGYNAKGFNRSGYDAKGYNAAGYDKQGFNREGWDADGYGRDGFDKAGFDRKGYDKAGYDKDGYNREGFDREGRQQQGYDEDGYDKNGFNKNGVDKDGFDREGFDYEGYNRNGYDPWGYDKQGYGKDGYHWSGYNADGYNRDGRHWSENPFEGDGNPFNVSTQDPFGEKEVIPFGATWVPTKPKLGEPYPKTLEKYGAKPWNNELPQPEVEKPTVPSPEDSGVIGPEDPMNTLKNHGIDKDAPTAPDDMEPVDAATPDGFPRDGEKRVLVGKTDGRSLEIEYDAKTGEWRNTENGNPVDPDKFEQWQDDLAEDNRRIVEDIEKMKQRQDANSKAIKKSLDDWQRLEQMQKAADKYNIGEPGGPGDVDKAIQNLKDDMLAGKEVDQDKLEQINKIIDNRIMGKTAGDTGERWEEDWFKNLGWALEANAATAREVVTGEKADGSTSWLGMGARIMIVGATGGTALVGQLGAQVAMDGALTVAEAMYRIKDSINKGESDFQAVSKAIGLLVLGEEIGYLAGAAGGTLMREMLERFPVFTNKAADFLEKGLLKIMKADQITSRGLGLVSKEGADETLKQINKRLTELGGDAAEEAIEKSAKGVGREIAGSSDDIAKGAGKAASGSGDDLGKGTGKAASGSGDDIARGGSAGDGSKTPDGSGKAAKAASASPDKAEKTPFHGADDAGKGTGKTAPGSGDDLTDGARKTVSGGDGPKAADGSHEVGKAASGGPDAPDGPGKAPSSGADDAADATGKAKGADEGSVKTGPATSSVPQANEYYAQPGKQAEIDSHAHINMDLERLRGAMKDNHLAAGESGAVYAAPPKAGVPAYEFTNTQTVRIADQNLVDVRIRRGPGGQTQYLTPQGELINPADMRDKILMTPAPEGTGMVLTYCDPQGNIRTYIPTKFLERWSDAVKGFVSMG